MSDGRDEHVAVRGLELHIRRWDGDGAPFVLVHGLASNARTWDGVARELNATGHAVVAVDQRGHGLSDKPETGYTFDEVTADLAALVGGLGFSERPIVVGQSWGANVVLDFATRTPNLARGIVLVDGGFIELSSRPGATWETVSRDLRPPLLAGTPRVDLEARLRQTHPEWSDEGIEGTLGNFETLPGGTIRPWLTLDRHLQILRALWEQRPSQLYASVRLPALLAVAETGDAEWTARKREALALVEARLPRARVVWFERTAHDIHVHRPLELTRLMQDALDGGFFTQ